MSKLGTLVLYDVENLKTPLNRKKGDYIVSRVDLLEVKESIRRVLDSVHFQDIAFVKSYHHSDHRYQKNQRFFDFLRNKGFEVEEKQTKKAKNVVSSKGERFVYSYEECDMDANIIHSMLTLGRDYDRVILLSGDDDMYNSLKFLQDEFKTDIIVMAHKENMSEKMKTFEHIYLHELLERGLSKNKKESL